MSDAAVKLLWWAALSLGGVMTIVGLYLSFGAAFGTLLTGVIVAVVALAVVWALYP